MSLKKYFKSLDKNRFAFPATLKELRFGLFDLESSLRVAGNAEIVNFYN